MRTATFGSYRIKKLSKEDMAEYFEKAFNNESVQKMLKSSPTLSSAKSNFQHFGNILQAYVCATGDVSESMIETLAADFEKHSDKLYLPVNADKIDGTQIYFADHVMPYIMKHYVPNFDKKPISLEETVDVLKRIKLNCHNNRFETHSFSGALLDEIKTNGLDINKEMFKNEYKILEEVGIFQPYQRGNLLFCELSKSTFGYALYSPERLFMSIRSSDAKQQGENQSIHEYLSESLENKLSGKNLPPEKHKKVLDAAQKIIDFYFGQNKLSAIAFKENSEKIDINISKLYQSEIIFTLNDYSFKSKIEKFCKSKGNTQLYEKYVKTINEVRENNDFVKMDNCIKEFNRQYPDNNLFKDAIKKAVTKSVTENCLNNFVYSGNSDGYRIEGGKLSPDKFGVASIPNPITLYTDYKKTEIAVEKEKYMAREYNRELYEKKYILQLKSGQEPEESFETYCANNISNTYYFTAPDKNGMRIDNPRYSQWKKEKGYTDCKSAASIELEDKIIRQKNRNKSNSTSDLRLSNTRQ